MEALIGLIFLAIPGIFVIRWLYLRSRFQSIEQQLSELSALPRRVQALEAEVDWLRRRLREQEAVRSTAPTPAPDVQPAQAPPPAPVIETPLLKPRSFCEWCGRPLEPGAECACREVEPDPPIVAETPVIQPQPQPEPEREPAMAFKAAEPAPPLAEPAREHKPEEWEALVGGNLLNKVGALILVIGIALFLGYSFTQMGPAGRSATALIISLAMLGSGFVVERIDDYRTFARGLLGGGWAALYFTVYAMSALPAAKVIDSPLAGTILLLAVASGMIAHSLRYRSQTLTGLTYFIAFVTLSISPLTWFSVIALVPLAASLLVVAYRFEWSEMALFGLFATWGTLISRGDSGSPAWEAQALFTVYWSLFEVFDLLRARRRTPYAAWESALFPLNALAFATLSFLKWSSTAPEWTYAAAAGISLAYLLSAVLRSFIRPPSSFDASDPTIVRITSGGYEGPVTLTAGLSAAAVLLRLRSGWASAGLIAEAECFFLAGLWFRQPYLEQLGATLFVSNFIKLFGVDIGGPARQWTPSAGASAVLFYANRYLKRPHVWYGYAAASVAALVLGFEVPERHLGMAWLAAASAAFLFGFFRRLQDFRLQGYALGFLALFAVAVYQADVASGRTPLPSAPWLPMAVAAVAGYAAVWCALRAGSRLGELERGALRAGASWAVTALAAAIAWRVVPDVYVGLAWLASALLVLELGIRGRPVEMKLQAIVLGGAGCAAVLLVNILPVRNDAALTLRLIPAYSALTAYLFAVRLYLSADTGRSLTLFSGAGTLFGCTALWALLPPVASGPAWAALALILAEIGLAAGLPAIERQGHLVSAAAFGRLFTANFATRGTTGVLSHRLLTVVPVAAGFYHLWNRLAETRIARLYSYAAAILIFALARFELGRTFAVAGWAALAVVWIYLGRRWNDRDFRWQSYIIVACVFIRSLTTNFTAPEALSGQAGRIGIGAFVISCLYAAQLISPRFRESWIGIESYARLYFSLAATALLTILLFQEVKGGMLTVSWGIESLALLAAGFPLRDRILRLSGLALFLVCILKLFLYDLRNLETMNRILSFIILGVLMLSVSWVYTRFRDRIQRYL